MMDPCSREPSAMLSIDAALEKIKAALQPVAESEKVALKNALGRVLSESVYSPINSPYDRNAAMDGYAFSSKDIHPEQPFTLTLAGTSWAGRPFQGAPATRAMCQDFYRRGSPYTSRFGDYAGTSAS